MARRKAIPARVWRLLYAHSGNRCAFPGCSAPIFEDSAQLTGECCHIEAYSPQGTRYNASQTDEERNQADNLMLLCSRHHKIIDGNPIDYTVAALHDMKAQHEQQYSAQTLEMTTLQLASLRNTQSEFWQRIDAIDHVEAIVPELKIVVDQSKSIGELLQNLDELLEHVDQLFREFSASDDRLNEEIRELLNKLDYDIVAYDAVPYYENPFVNRNWELHALATTNVMNHVKMVMYQLVIRLLEELSTINGTIHPLLPPLREKLIELQKNNYYAD